MAGLEAFLAMAERRRFQPGEWDCCLMVADWVRECTGIDGAAPWRGRYRSERGFLRHLKVGGGVLGVVGRGASLAGLNETKAPVRGDIGVIETAQGQVGAICLGERWAVATQAGFGVVPGQVLAAWRVYG